MATSAKPPDTDLDKLSIIVFSGSYEKIHYALAMAAASISVDRPATLFFTMKALHALRRPNPNGEPAWHALPSDDENAAARDCAFGECGVGRFEELLDACLALGVKFMVCEMGLRAENIVREDLRDDIAFVEGGLVSFYADATGRGAIIVI